ncbi:hypothetical protein BH11MYX1_BH11MYX1_40940 [soil metagenome]
MSDAADTDPQTRITKARADLTEKLDELRRREEKVRESIAPMRHLQHLASPWLRVGLAALAGLSIGKRSVRSTSTAMVRYREPSMFDSVAKIAVIAVSAVAIYRSVVSKHR